MAFIKEPDHDPRDMNAHANDDLVIYHLKRIQLLLLLIVMATLFSAAMDARGPLNIKLTKGLWSAIANEHKPESSVPSEPAAE